ncbi:MAG: substrate-binding domain-containing protein [Oscillospiraceae bacterium]|jgi:phosphate transport system substrate-binding protein|nr:substrate-binding domain-containing protein [Oscillospiraceae bacterium]
MNRRTAIVLAAVFAALLLTSCGGDAEQVSPFGAPSETVTASPKAAATPDPTAQPIALKGDELQDLWRRIDGSTATIPLTTALHDHFGGVGDPPTHYTTPDAYHNLCDSRANIIFATYPSEDELVEARGQNVELEIVPIAKDALVFLVNAENPLDGVSQKQLRGIYTGEITNWKTLSGLDESVVPYQRTSNSGSQTLFIKLLMGDLEPMRPPTEWIAETMGGLVEAVSGYDNAQNAVGYSMFYYVNNMYGSDRFKLLSVDGVKPSRDTITRGAYPLEDHYYAVIRKNTPADSPARKLVAWLLTDEGQTLIAKAGYIPLRPLENIFPDASIDPIYLGDVDNSSGTGGTKPKPDEADEMVVNGVREPLSDIFYDGFNYIRYINSEIVNHMNAPKSAYAYSELPDLPLLSESVKRPFTGIPNNYTNYELWDDTYRRIKYLRIILPEGNPFFNRTIGFDVRLTGDISPYGTAADEWPLRVMYDYAGRLLPNVNIYTMRVSMPQSPEVAERINEQLAAWYDGFPRQDDKVELIDKFVKLKDNPDYVYNFQPLYGQWDDYLSVSYVLQNYDGPANNAPMVYTIGFSLVTGQEITLADKLPQDIPYLRGMAMVFDSMITQMEEGERFLRTIYENDYTPAEGSVITSAWLLDNSLGLYVTEPDGRKLQATIYDFKNLINE